MFCSDQFNELFVAAYRLDTVDANEPLWFVVDCRAAEVEDQP